jgi:DNA-binding NarL/FixJ family response regulator
MTLKSILTLKKERQDRRKNIIIVADDDLFSRSVLKVALQDMAEIIEAASGGDTFALYKRYNPDVLLLDLHMPGKNSHDVLKSILAYDKSAYILMISGDAVGLEVQKSQNTGAKGFIAKPFSQEKLMAHILPCPTLLFGYDEDKVKPP